MFKLFSAKRKVFIVIIIAVILIGLSSYLVVDFKRERLILKKDTIIVEYGQTISTDPKYYLNTSKLNNSDKNDVLKNTKLQANFKNEIELINNLDGTKSERDKGYAEIGTYKVTLKYRNEIKTVKIVVKDTTKPNLIVPENVDIVLGTDINNFDFKSLMQASDLAVLGDYVIDTNSVDTNKIGDYCVKVSIEDINKNRAEEEFKVTIILPPRDDSKSVKATTKKKANSLNDPSSSSKSSDNKNTNARPSNDSIINNSGGDSNESDNIFQNDSNVDKNNGHYEMFYCCLDHFNETYGKYHTLQELIDAGHFTGGCGCNNYSYGEEWVED